MAATVYEVVRDVVAEQAPHELPIVEGLGKLDQNQIVRLLRRGPRGEPLGFGLPDLVVLVTPVVWIAIEEVTRKSVGRAAGGIGAKLSTLLRRHRPVTAGTIPMLTGEQLEEVHRLVGSGAVRAGMDQAEADALADHVITRLMLDRPPDRTEKTGETTEQS
ncbi:hypothetical protein ACFHYQ_28070 [Sphaerimonospora cavernae]|uniref:Uncharacterized protein n=1 Tax=Sphaerimonospora cavernae TaxID=1740611 RepID=A0ABV6UDA3_9ACTN